MIRALGKMMLIDTPLCAAENICTAPISLIMHLLPAA